MTTPRRRAFACARGTYPLLDRVAHDLVPSRRHDVGAGQYGCRVGFFKNSMMQRHDSGFFTGRHFDGVPSARRRDAAALGDVLARRCRAVVVGVAQAGSGGETQRSCLASSDNIQTRRTLDVGSALLDHASTVSLPYDI